MKREVCCPGLVKTRGMQKRPAENMLMMEFYREGDLSWIYERNICYYI